MRNCRSTFRRKRLFSQKNALKVNVTGTLIRGDHQIVNDMGLRGRKNTTSSRLYNLAHDPGETTDLAETLPELTKELATEWETNWR